MAKKRAKRVTRGKTVPKPCEENREKQIEKLVSYAKCQGRYIIGEKTDSERSQEVAKKKKRRKKLEKN